MPGKLKAICSQVFGMALTLLSAWIAWLAWKERRRWLLIQSAVYGLVSGVMTVTAFMLGPDPHDVFGAAQGRRKVESLLVTNGTLRELGALASIQPVERREQVCVLCTAER